MESDTQNLWEEKNLTEQMLKSVSNGEFVERDTIIATKSESKKENLSDTTKTKKGKILIDTSSLSLYSCYAPIPFECEQCCKTFYRKKNDVMRWIRGTKPIVCCSRKCAILFNSKSIKCKCKTCERELMRIIHFVLIHVQQNIQTPTKSNSKKKK